MDFGQKRVKSRDRARRTGVAKMSPAELVATPKENNAKGYQANTSYGSEVSNNSSAYLTSPPSPFADSDAAMKVQTAAQDEDDLHPNYEEYMDDSAVYGAVDNHDDD